MLMNAGLNEQRGFDKRGVARAIALPFVELAKDNFCDARVDDGIEPVELGAIGENQRRELGAVHAALTIGNRRAEFAEDFLVGRLAGLDQFVSERVGVKNRKTQFAEHRCNGALAAGDSTGQSESQHFSDHRAVAVD